MTTFCDPVNKSHDSRAKSADDPPFPPSYFPLPTTLITRQSSFSPPLIARRLPRAISLQALFRVKNSKRIGQVAVFSSRTRFGTNDDGKKKIEKRRTRFLEINERLDLTIYRAPHRVTRNIPCPIVSVPFGMRGKSYPLRRLRTGRRGNHIFSR